MDLIAFIIAAIVIVIGISLARKAVEHPKQVPLAPDENRLGEMFGKTRDVTLGGFTAAGSALEGKLVLTTKRLLYTRYDEKWHAFTIVPDDLISVEVGQTGFLFKKPTLKITFLRGRRRKKKVVRWVVPEKATVAGNPLLFVGDKSWVNPNTAASFSELLKTWKAGASGNASQ